MSLSTKEERDLLESLRQDMEVKYWVQKWTSRAAEELMLMDIIPDAKYVERTSVAFEKAAEAHDRQFDKVYPDDYI